MIYAGFILGFDGERTGAGDRIQAFVEQTHIPQPMLGLLQALPHTALWERLKTENRLKLKEQTPIGDQNTLMNFEPTRPIDEIAKEYVAGFWSMYEPSRYLRRCLHQCLSIGESNLEPNKDHIDRKTNPQPPPSSRKQTMKFPLNKGLRLVAQVIWWQGIRRADMRRQFWQQLIEILRKRPQMFNLYIGLCAAGEHFWQYRIQVRERIAEQIGYDLLSPSSDSLKTHPVSTVLKVPETVSH